MSSGMFDHVMSYGMHVYTHVMRQYEFSNSHKAWVVLLP